MEAIKHLLGFCGDTWHPSVLNIGLLSTPLIVLYRTYLLKIKNILKFKLWKLK